MDVLPWKLFGLLIYLGVVCEGGEYCGYYSTTGYYTTDYCSGYCCDSEYDNCCTSWGWIAGAVVGGIVLVSVVVVLVFMICAKMKAKKTRTVHVEMQQSTSTGAYNNYNKPNRRAAPPQYPAPPPPYMESYNYGGGPYGAYGAPPPYPGTPGPGSAFAPNGSGMQTTSLNTNDPVYPPPPPVS